MGFASYLEDVTGRLAESFNSFNRAYTEFESADKADIISIRQELVQIKMETAGLIRVLEDQVLELMTSPDIDVFDEWQTSLTENSRLKATLNGTISLEEAEKLKQLKDTFLRLQWELNRSTEEIAHLSEENRSLKQQLDEANQMAMDNIFRKANPVSTKKNNHKRRV